MRKFDVIKRKLLTITALWLVIALPTYASDDILTPVATDQEFVTMTFMLQHVLEQDAQAAGREMDRTERIQTARRIVDAVIAETLDPHAHSEVLPNYLAAEVEMAQAVINLFEWAEAEGYTLGSAILDLIEKHRETP